MLSSQYNIQQNLQSGYAGIQIFEDINTSADQSVRVGEGAGKLSYGTGNAFVGYQAGEQNLAGSYDTFIGYQAGQLNQNSDATTLIGAFAGRQNTGGSETVFVGFRAGEFNLNGNQNVGVGAYALRENNSGSATTAVGWRAAERNLDGDYNTMIGAEAGQNNRSGNYNTMAGYQVGRAAFSGSENTFFGAYAGYSNELGSDNCLIGFKAGLDVYNGNFNIAIGAYSLSTGRSNASGAPSDCNVVIGAFTNTTGSGNVVLGLNAGSNSSGDDNVLIGKDVALVYAGRKSVIVGADALIHGNGQCNTMLGYGIAPDLINGSNNVFIGVGANTFGSDVSYAIAIGTSNVKTYSHSIAIGDGIDNSRREGILVGFDINSDADNSVIVGKSLNIRNAIVFKDPIAYPYVATINTKADQLFGPTDINYTYLLNSPPPSNVIYAPAGAGQYTSNITSSRGNRTGVNYEYTSNYNLITINGQYDYTIVHHASAMFTSNYNSFNDVIPADSVIRYYSKYGSNFNISSNIGLTANINSVANLYTDNYTIDLTYDGLNNVVTNLTKFNTSNAVYNIYLQKQVQPIYFENTGDTSCSFLSNVGLLNGAIVCSNVTLTTGTMTDTESISPSLFTQTNLAVQYIVSDIPQYGLLNNYIVSRSYSNAIDINSCNVSADFTYTPIREYAFAYASNHVGYNVKNNGNNIANSNITDTFKIYPFLQIHNNQNSLYGITSNVIDDVTISISRPIDTSNIIVRNNILFNSTNAIATHVFTSNDFAGIPNGIDATCPINITSYDSTYLDLYTPSSPFTYSDIKNGSVYISQKTNTSSFVDYQPIIGTITDGHGVSIPFTISMSNIPTNIMNILPSYEYALVTNPENSIATTYTLPNIPINNLWTTKASSNSDLQIVTSGITNLNQNTYRRINPFVSNDQVTLVLQNGVNIQEVGISFSNTSNYIYHTTLQHVITNEPIITHSNTYQYKSTTIEPIAILNTCNLYTSNITINVETSITTPGQNAFQSLTFNLAGAYDNTYGYSNVWSFDYLSNIYPINKQTGLNPNGEVTVIYTELTSNYVYSIDKNILGTPGYTSNVISVISFSNEAAPDISYTSNIIHNVSNVIFLAQASNYTYEKVNQIQNSYYNYGLINTYQSLLLYTSNTTSNISASNISVPYIISSSSNLVQSGINYSSNSTSNLLRFYETHTSNAVLPMTRAMMYKQGGSFAFNTANNFKAVLSNVGTVNNWTQQQIDNGSLYLQLPSNNPNETITDVSNIIQELTTSTIFTNNYRLYNTSLLSLSAFVPDTCNVSYIERYTSGGKSVRGIYNIKSILQYVKDHIGISGFTASQFFILYLDTNVNTLLLNSSLIQTTAASAFVTDDTYMVRTNQTVPVVNAYFFAINAAGTTITNIFKVPIRFNDIPPSGIPRQGFNIGMSVGKKNILDSAIFNHSWSNLDNTDLKFNITSTLAGANYTITSNYKVLTDADKSFTFEDCLQNKIGIEPLTLNITAVITYDLVNRQDDTVLVPNLSYTIGSYEYYAFPTTYEIGSNSSITTLLYGSNAVQNIFSAALSSNITNFKDAANSNVNLSDLSLYIEKPPVKGILCDENGTGLAYKTTLDKKFRYISYTPDDIDHDTAQIRLGYKNSNVSPIYSIHLSNYAVPFITNGAVEAGAKASNIPINAFIVSTNSNINRYLTDGNTFSSNSIPVPVMNTYPLVTHSYPIGLYDRNNTLLASTTLQVKPFALSSKPLVSSTNNVITINANEFSQTSLKPLLNSINTGYDWNSRVDFVLTTPTGLSTGEGQTYTSNGVIMKKSYVNNSATSFTLTPVAHFTNEELLRDEIVYQHIGSLYNSQQVITDTFTCYATAGEYSYNPSLITVNVKVFKLPYIKTVSDDYVYYNTIHAASNGINPLNKFITVATTSNIYASDDLSFSVIATSNIDIVNINPITHTGSNIVSVFSVADFDKGYVGYRIKPAFLSTNDYTQRWPFSFSLAPDGISSAVTTSNELVNIPAYSNVFKYDARAALNIYESSNIMLYPQTTDQNLSYTFSQSDTFINNVCDISFQIKPSQAISTIGMSENEFIDSSDLRTFDFTIKLGDVTFGSNILDARITHSNITLYAPYHYYEEFTRTNTLVFDQWNVITISSTDQDIVTKASININSYPIYLNNPLDINNLKYIGVDIDETNNKNFTSNITLVNTTNPYGNLPLTYLITNYATTLYLRNFEIDIYNPYSSTVNYDPFTNNVVIGKNLTVKGTDNITIGKQFSTTGQNNIILGNYIGVDRIGGDVTTTNDIYESIIIGNNSFINATIQNIIAIGNSNLNDLLSADVNKINEFIAQNPIIIGNSITSKYIDYYVNIGNTFLKTNNINSQVYLGIENEKVAIGYNENLGFSAYQDLYVAHGIYVGAYSSTDPNNSNQYALTVQGDVNFTGSLYQNGTPYGGGGGSNTQWTTIGSDIYYSGGSVGVGQSPNNIYAFDVLGNINFTGNLYQNGILYPLGGGGGTGYGDGSNASNIWVHSCNIASVLVPGAGAVSYSSASNSIFRHCDNDIEYAFDLTFTITTGSGGVGDYKLEVPFEVDTSYYLNNSIIGSAWSCIRTGSLSNYFPLSIRSPTGTHQSNVIIRFMNGTTETPLSILPSGTTVQLAGMVNYVSTSIFPTIGLGGGGGGNIWIPTVYGIYNSNNTNVGIGTSIPRYTLDVNGNINFASNLYQRNVLIDLTQINIATSNINKVNPWITTPTRPQLLVPSPGTFTYSSTSNSIYRHIDNDVEYAFNFTTTLTQTSGTGDYKISLPVPYNSNYYVPNTIIGSIWSRVITGGLSNYLPVSVSTIAGGDSNYMAVRFINGTTETPMSILTTGTSLQLSGTIEYVAPVYPRSGIFLSNVCYQDDYGHVGFNTFGPMRAEVDIVNTTDGIAGLYVEQQAVGSGNLAIFDGYGNVGIGTAIPREKLDVNGNIIVSGDILPSACNIYNLGNSNYRFKDIYLSGASIDLEGIKLTKDAVSGGLQIQTSDTSTPFIIGSAGNIGIGTTLPIVPLHVEGVAYVSTNIGIGTTVPKEMLDVNGNSIISGCVGIGTTIPTQKLHIQGSSYISNTIFSQGIAYLTSSASAYVNTTSVGTIISRSIGDANTILTISQLSGVGTGKLLDVKNTSGSLIVINNNGNLGIGTTMPHTKLDVIGDTFVSGNIGIGTTLPRRAIDVVGGSIIVSNNIGIGTTLPKFSLDVQNLVYFNSNIGIGTTMMRTTLDIIGDTIMTGNIGIGTTLPRRAIDIVGGSIIVSNNIGIGTTLPKFSLDIQNLVYFNSNVGIGTTIMRTTLDIIGNTIVTGNIGIGTTLPRKEIDVIGNINFTGDLYKNNSLYISTQWTTYNSNIYITGSNVGIGTTLPNALVHVGAGTTTVAPILLTSGTNLTTATAGAIEYDGVKMYGTVDATSGRGYFPNYQLFRLTADGSAINTINNFFGTTSSINMVAAGIYELEAYCYFLKTGNNTVVFTLTTSQNVANLNATLDYGALAGGTATGAANRISLFSSATTANAFAASGTLTGGANHAFIIRSIIESNATLASTLTINVTATGAAGQTVTPLRGSYYKLTRLPAGNVGVFS